MYFYQLFVRVLITPQQHLALSTILIFAYEVNDISLLFYWKQLVNLSTIKYLKYVLYNLVMFVFLLLLLLLLLFTTKLYISFCISTMVSFLISCLWHEKKIKSHVFNETFTNWPNTTIWIIHVAHWLEMPSLSYLTPSWDWNFILFH